MTSPRSVLPEESAVPRLTEAMIADIRRTTLKASADIGNDDYLKAFATVVLALCSSHEALRSLLSDRDETIKALRAELDIARALGTGR